MTKIPQNWSLRLDYLENQYKIAILERGSAQRMKSELEAALSEAELEKASANIINRLDDMLIRIIGIAKENVCTNTKCPHYNKKCKMR